MMKAGLWCVSLGLFFLRLIAGGIFAAHGYPKLFGGPDKQVSPEVARYLGQGFVQSMQHGGAGFAKGLESMDIPEPESMAKFVGVVEFFGGLLLVLGLFTRFVALLLSGDMVVAIWKVHWKNGLTGPGGFEFPLSMLAACLALVTAGPGEISLSGESIEE